MVILGDWCMGYNKNKWEVYGRWIEIKPDPNNEHILVIKLYRNKPMKHEYMQKMNTLYGNKNITFWVEVNFNYDEFQKKIAEEVAKQKQATL